MTKQELLPRAKTYFDNNKSLKKIYGTEDRHFFYEEGYVIRYCKGNVKYFTFFPDDFSPEKIKAAAEAEEKAEAKADLDAKAKAKVIAAAESKAAARAAVEAKAKAAVTAAEEAKAKTALNSKKEK